MGESGAALKRHMTFCDSGGKVHSTSVLVVTPAMPQGLLASRTQAQSLACLPHTASLLLCPPYRRRRRREAGRQVRNGVPGRGGVGSPADASKQQPSSLSALMLTTGTPLMLELHQSLAYYICKRLADPETEHLQFELSDSTVKVRAWGLRSKNRWRTGV